MSAEKEVKLSKELKVLLLSILKKASISEVDVSQISRLSGIEPMAIEVEIIDRREQVENQ